MPTAHGSPCGFYPWCCRNNPWTSWKVRIKGRSNLSGSDLVPKYGTRDRADFQRQNGDLCISAATTQAHGAKPVPPGRTAGSNYRPPTRLKKRAQKLLPRFKIVDPTWSKTPFRINPVPYPGTPAVMEEILSRSLHVSRMLHPLFVHRLPPGCHGR